MAWYARRADFPTGITISDETGCFEKHCSECYYYRRSCRLLHKILEFTGVQLSGADFEQVHSYPRDGFDRRWMWRTHFNGISRQCGGTTVDVIVTKTSESFDDIRSGRDVNINSKTRTFHLIRDTYTEAGLIVFKSKFMFTLRA